VEVLVQHFHKIMYCFQITEIIVVNIHADAEIQARIPSVYYLEITKLKYTFDDLVTLHVNVKKK